MIHTALLVFHVCVCVLLVGIVLLQQGKGADAGAAFGGGSNTVFGAGGADTFLTKFTTVLAFLFMTTSFSLALQASTTGPTEGVLFRGAPQKAGVEAPVSSDTTKNTPTETKAPETGVGGSSATTNVTATDAPAAQANIDTPVAPAPAVEVVTPNSPVTPNSSLTPNGSGPAR